jgi:hypothetical protein
MLYFAYHRDEYLIADESLDAVLAFVRECIDPTAPEDAVIWKNGLVVAVVLATGRVIRLDALAVLSPEVPADLARLDEAAA